MIIIVEKELALVRKQKFYCELCREFSIENRHTHLQKIHNGKLPTNAQSRLSLFEKIFVPHVISRPLLEA